MSGSAGDVREVSGLRKGKMCPAGGGTSQYTFESRRGLAPDFQSLQVERHGEQSAFVRIGNVAAGQIAGVKAAPQNRLSLSGSHRVHDDLRVLVVVGARVGREQNCFAPWQ